MVRLRYLLFLFAGLFLLQTVVRAEVPMQETGKEHAVAIEAPTPPPQEQDVSSSREKNSDAVETTEEKSVPNSPDPNNAPTVEEQADSAANHPAMGDAASAPAPQEDKPAASVQAPEVAPQHVAIVRPLDQLVKFYSQEMQRIDKVMSRWDSRVQAFEDRRLDIVKRKKTAQSNLEKIEGDRSRKKEASRLKSEIKRLEKDLKSVLKELKSLAKELRGEVKEIGKESAAVLLERYKQIDSDIAAATQEE